MSETVDLSLIGAMLRILQAEQRTIRDELALMRESLSRSATKAETIQVLDVLSRRIGNFEALVDTRVDGLTTRLVAFEAMTTARFDAIAAQLTDIAAKLK